MKTVRISLVVLSLVLAGCGSTSSTSTSGSSASSGGAPPAAGHDPDAEAVHNVIRDARVVLYQPKTQATFVVVNEDNRLRETREGRMELSNGDPRTGYKVLSDRQIDSLLVSMENRGANRLREPWTPAHARYFGARDGQLPGFRGIILVENEGRTDVYVGRRPEGQNDVDGQERYRTFVDLKWLVVSTYNATTTVERPDDSAIGISPASELDLPGR